MIFSLFLHILLPLPPSHFRLYLPYNILNHRAITGKGINSPSGRGYGVSQHGGYGNEKMDQRSTYQDHYRYL